MEFTENIEKFFKKNKKKLCSKNITICMGNEACDLDSFISSLVFSHAIDVLFVVNMRKDVFHSKGDLMYICKKFKINTTDLIFLERPLGSFSKEAKTVGTYFLVSDEKHFITEKNIKLILTDHNEPIDELKHCDVEIIIDHHPLTGKIKNTSKIYIDTNIGSATTLVSQYLGHDLSKKSNAVNRKIKINRSPFCAQIAELLLLPILVDTKFLKTRVSSFDVAEYKKLKKISCIKKKILKKEVKNIKKARRNDNKLDTNTILLKDYKFYTAYGYNFGMSVIKYNFEKWIDREANLIQGKDKNKEGIGLFCELQSFKKLMGLDFYIVSTKIKNKRTVIFLEYPFIKNLYDIIGAKKMEYRGLTFYQIDVSITRKLLIPIIIEHLKKIEIKN